MKKAIAVLLALLVFTTSASADFNALYTMIDVVPFTFAAPPGFYQIGDEWTNGKESFTVEYQPWDTSGLLNDTAPEILQRIDSTFGEAFGESWCGSLYAEKSGGCYKIGSIVQNSAEIFVIVTACPEGVLIVISSPADTSSGMDLAHGIFKTISYVEYTALSSNEVGFLIANRTLLQFLPVSLLQKDTS